MLSGASRGGGEVSVGKGRGTWGSPSRLRRSTTEADTRRCPPGVVSAGMTWVSHKTRIRASEVPSSRAAWPVASTDREVAVWQTVLAHRE